MHYVAPLYLEKLHLLYSKEAFKQYITIDSPDSIPLISTISNESTLNFFANSRINTAPVGSGTRVIASYLLAEINKQILGKNLAMRQQIKNTSGGYKQLENGKIDIFFSIAGAPLKEVESLLAANKFGLMSIDPSIIASLNEIYGINLRMADFKNKYTGTSNISTIGTYAFLIASVNIPNLDILELLKVLHDSKEEIKNKLGLKSVESFQLDEFDFLDIFKAEHERTLMKKISDILIFLFSIVVATALVCTILLWIVSVLKQNTYFRKISVILKKTIPENTEFEEGRNYPIPKTPLDQKVNIAKIINGMKRLYIMTNVINEDYYTGGITDSHHIFLSDNVYTIKMRLQNIFAQSINDDFEKGNTIPLEELRAFYTAGYLSMDDFVKLKYSCYKEFKKKKIF